MRAVEIGQAAIVLAIPGIVLHNAAVARNVIDALTPGVRSIDQQIALEAAAISDLQAVICRSRPIRQQSEAIGAAKPEILGWNEEIGIDKRTCRGTNVGEAVHRGNPRIERLSQIHLRKQPDASRADIANVDQVA